MLPPTEKWWMQTVLAPSPASQWRPSTGCWSSLSSSSQASLCTPSCEQTASAGSSQDRSMSIKTENTHAHRPQVTECEWLFHKQFSLLIIFWDVNLLMLQVMDEKNNLCELLWFIIKSIMVCICKHLRFFCYVREVKTCRIVFLFTLNRFSFSHNSEVKWSCCFIKLVVEGGSHKAKSSSGQ